jgi:glutathione S-transferase
VQRAVIVLRAKAIAFEVTYIDLREKPDWFLAISPHGKVPVLQVDGEPLFESNAIAEYLDEAEPPRLHPESLEKRARNRAWTDFVPTFAAALSGTYYVRDDADIDARLATARDRLGKLEEALRLERGNEGPYFNGPELSLVDAAYAPFLQRFSHVERWLRRGLLREFPLVRSWTGALLGNDVVVGSVPEGFFETFNANMLRRGFRVGELMAADPTAGASAG